MKLLAIVTASLVLFSSTSAHAIGSSGSSLDPTPKVNPKPKPKSPKKLACKRNQTGKRVKGKWTCIKLKVGALDDYDLFQQARILTEEGEYEWALDHLSLIVKSQNHEVLTYTGYANRKAGRLETGINYYQQAISSKPDFAEARAYLGEAYVLTGMTDRALEQLHAIAAICGETCEPYQSLNAFINSDATH